MSLDLEAIKARANAATAGPWFRWEGHAEVFSGEPSENSASSVRGFDFKICEVDPDRDDDIDECDDDMVAASAEDDADFIAHARTDIPDLVREVERLRDELAKSQT